jgi:hypothetical protein
MHKLLGAKEVLVIYKIGNDVVEVADQISQNTNVTLFSAYCTI